MRNPCFQRSAGAIHLLSYFFLFKTARVWMIGEGRAGGIKEMLPRSAGLV